ncbi:probable RNA-directed DNA polymerase from transposon X-element [Trichonephila clavipes]|nr:probable RNA-directed DNA polymerase from transposon X-element [Trichonephila clavipes]
METGFSKFFRSSLRDAEIILRAGQRIISEINILVENSQGSSQIPKSNPQLLNAEIKKKIARHENIKTRFLKWGNRVTPIAEKKKKAVGTKSSIRKIRASSESDASNNMDRDNYGITDTDQKLNILQLNNRFITHPQLQADLFADYFASKNAYHEPLPLDFLYAKNNLLNKPFHILELHSAIKNSNNTTPGADHVTAIFFKNLDQGQRDVILRYFQKLFDNAIVPDSWKHAILLPIPKPCKDKTNIFLYRPIALTSVFSKTFERILANRISCYLTKERKLHPQHYGFVPFKDSRSATYLVHKAIMNAKLQKIFFVGISLDIKSAYDSVYVDGLIYKCLQIGITGNIANWIHNFLTSRSFQIKWRGYFSPKKLVPQGLAQGSVLSPILYTIYMHDIFETLESEVECLVYADDIFIFCSHKSLAIICKNYKILWKEFSSGVNIGN